MHPDGTRPDLVGFDENGAERVLVEVKFWADLTPNQPNGYLKRLPDDGPTVLVFLAPDDRIRWLWPELRHRVEKAGHTLSVVDAERECLRIEDSHRHLMIVSWAGLLDSMAARSRDSGESGIDADIRQLRSLATYADAGAFKPIRQGEEFGADSDRLLRDYKRLVDDATDLGAVQGWASKKGLNRTPRSYGYGRYVRLRRTIVWFDINRDQFEKTGETPLWLEGFPESTDKIGETLAQFGLTDNWIPVDLKRDVEYPQILDGVVDSLGRIADVIDGACYQFA